jgi:hypothetical protein
MDFKKILVTLGMVLLVAGCSSRPIVNVTDQPVITAGGKQVSADQVRGAIIGAGTGLGWVMTPISPGLISGRFASTDHVAVVDVRYTEKTYSITYKDSTNLNYKGTQIHKSYNAWVEALDRDIRGALLRM